MTKTKRKLKRKVPALRPTDLAAAHAAVLEGLPVTAFDRLVAESGFPAADLAAAADIPPTTLVRRRREGRFSKEESERLIRLEFVIRDALDLFEQDAESARAWLQRPRPVLGDVKPLELAKTEFGARMVRDLIGRLQHGVFS
jgi:putative toxin-antitoxin system antitoxin component (TIGR02293 family)